MNIHIQDSVVIIEGRLDSLNAQDARESLLQVDRSVTIDLSKLEYISSAGLGVLLELKKRLVGIGHDVALSSLTPHIHRLFELSGMDQVFAIDP